MSLHRYACMHANQTCVYRMDVARVLTNMYGYAERVRM
jgi:hypothetical protein